MFLEHLERRRGTVKKHAIIPIFIPHLGCPNDCVFCNQRKITARTAAPSLDDVRATIEEWLTTLSDAEEVEVAFYGGSFTGLDIEEQSAYLAVADEYLKEGRITGIHLSTRPDYIDREILDNLKKYHVSTIEIGVQSFDDKVLKASNRGHTAEDVYKACDLIKQYGFRLGIQLMIGLPGDTLEASIFSAKEAAKIKPELARLYPTIVLDDTRLLEMYNEGSYKALSREEAVHRTAEMYKILDNTGIYIMRVGLKSTDIIGDGGAINGGTYHPAFRQLVEGEIMRERIEAELGRLGLCATTKGSSQENQAFQEKPIADKQDSREKAIADKPVSRAKQIKVDVYSSPAWFSNMIGNSGCNKKYFQEKYPKLNIKYRTCNNLKAGECRIEVN